MSAFSRSSQNDKKIYTQNIPRILSYGATCDSNDVAVLREVATVTFDGSVSDHHLSTEPVNILDLAACEGASVAVQCIVYDSSNIDVESCNFKVRVESFESDDESNSIIKSVAALEHSKKFTDSETTALTESTDYSDWSVKNGAVDQPMTDEQSRMHCTFHGCGRGFHIPGWKAYNRCLDSNPVVTKALTSFGGWFLGDFITQTMLTKDHAFDFHRSMTMSSFGLFYHGPIGHFVYDILDYIIIGTGPREVVTKICIDQLLWCPIFMICYFSYLGIWNGDSVSVIISKIHLDLLTAITTSWKIWPLAHAIQFRWVATKHRIIYINCIEVCFIMFLSFLANR